MHRWGEVTLFPAFAVAAAFTTYAAATTASSADVADAARTLPLPTPRTIAFETREGTQLSLDLSPDGRTLIFDLIGDLYTLPIEGGQARRLTSGAAWDTQAVFSPDGQRIAFISDRNGTKNLWVMNADGNQARMVSAETGMRIGSPSWMPDGNAIVVRRESPFSTDGANESFIVTVSVADGRMTRIYPEEQEQFVSGAAVTPDGRTLYLSAGPRFDNPQVYALDRVAGTAVTVSDGFGFAPALSPDGRWLVYTAERDRFWGLRLRELQTGREEWLVASVPWSGRAPSWSNFIPRYVFARDGKSVIFNAGGRINRVDVATGHISDIPFSAKVEVPAAVRLDAQRRIDDGDELTVQHPRGVNSSADAKRWVFSAVGQVWMTQSGIKTRQLTRGSGRAFMPVISPDGRWVAYAIYTDAGGMQIFKQSSTGSEAFPLTAAGGYYHSLAWTPDGKRLIYVGSAKRCDARFPSYSRACTTAELGWISADGLARGVTRSTVSAAAAPTAAGAGADARVFYLDRESNDSILSSVRFDGSDARRHAKFSVSLYDTPPVSVTPSPDGRRILFIYRNDAYLVELKPGAAETAIDLIGASGGLHRLTVRGASAVGWADSGNALFWVTTRRINRVSLKEALGAAGPERLRPKTNDLEVRLAREISRGTLLLRGARLITMKGDEIIPAGDILLKRNRIEAIEPAGTIRVPKGARVMDLTGKTIIPGLIDGHNHLSSDEIVPQAAPDFASALAYGVTTARDPSASLETLRWAEFIEAGALVGPRLFGVGFAFHPRALTVRRYEDARRAVALVTHQGAVNIKQYKQPQRIQKQWIRMAAQEAGFNITNEGGYSLEDDLTMALDGMSAMEHSIRTLQIHDDVIQVMVRSGMVYNPTLITMTSYWSRRADYHGIDKLHRFIPHERWVDMTAHGNPASFDTREVRLTSESVGKIVHSGGRVGVGAHGDAAGSIAVHWELWTLAWGGMSPMEVLRAGTLTGAQGMGFGADIGSLEPGKLADLLVLDANPLEDIQNTDTIRYVVKNGIVYDGGTLDEIWPNARRFPEFPWLEQERAFMRLQREQQGPGK